LGENKIFNFSKEPMEFYTSRILIPELIDVDKDFDSEYFFENKKCS